MQFATRSGLPWDTDCWLIKNRLDLNNVEADEFLFSGFSTTIKEL
jgi:hypothetical protein